MFRRKDSRRRILFVCMGNSCRSPMAEAFACALGGDIIVAESAGILPSKGISKLSRRVMRERNTPIRKRMPRLVSSYHLPEFDLVVNMTGQPLRFAHAAAVVEWDVPDPAGMKLAAHREVRDRIEALVRNLVANLRFRDGFAPRRDRAQRAGAGAASRLFVMAALLAGAAFSTPLYEEPADYAGRRTALDLGPLDGAGRNVWISWQIEAVPDGGIHYQYDFGGLYARRNWRFSLESRDPILGDELLQWDLTRNATSVSFYCLAAPVWGNFTLSSGPQVLVLNAGWTSPDSAWVSDFIARPGAPDVSETPEPSGFIPLAVLLAAVIRQHSTRAKLKPTS